MKQKVWIIILAVLAVLLIAAAAVIWTGVLGIWQLPAETPTEPAPDFTAYTADGTAVKLSDFAGKPVVLNFWASWCGPCKSEMPAFEAAYQAQGDDIQFLMVNLTDGTSETIQSATDFLTNAGYTFPVFYDTAGEGNTAYSVVSIPATYFIDADGNIVASHVGAMNESTLQGYLKQIAS